MKKENLNIFTFY